MSTAVRPAIGANASVVIGDETVQGTPAASMDYRYDFTTESISATENTLESASIRRGRRRPQTIRGTIDVSGDLNAELAPIGFGRMYRHALGLAETAMEDVDGGAHGRIGAANGASIEHDDVFFEFAFDSVTGFAPTVLTVGAGPTYYITGITAGGSHYLLYNDDDYSLVLDDPMGGYDYEEFQPPFSSTIHTGATLVSTAPAGNADRTTFGNDFLRIYGTSSDILNTLNDQAFDGTDYGYFYVEHDDMVYRIGYSHVTRIDGTTFDVQVKTVNGDVLDGTSPFGGTLPAGTPVYAPATMFNASGLFTGHSIAKGYGLNDDQIPSGAWVLGLWTDAAESGAPTLYTSYFQIGENLPIGLTVEVFRDAANFVYTGMQINEWSVTIDAQAIVTTTHSLTGIAEYSVCKLVKPLVTGGTTLFVDREPVAFPASGELTVGHFTDIAYSLIEAPGVGGNSDADDIAAGYYKFTVSSVSEAHRIGEAVVSRDSIADPFPDVATSAKFSAFEGAIYLKDEAQEVLSASFTVSNNIADEKYIIGSRFRAAVIEGDAIVTGTMTVEFDDGELYRKFIDGEKFSLEMALLSEDPSLTSVAGLYVPHETYFFFPAVKANGSTPNVGDTSYIEQEVPFDAFEDTDVTANTAPICVFVVNTSSTDF